MALSTNAATTDPTRFVLINLRPEYNGDNSITSTSGTRDGHDRLSSGSAYSVGYTAGSFVDVSTTGTNTGTGTNNAPAINHSDNRFTFSVLDNNNDDVIPSIIAYSAEATESGTGDALLGTDLIIDFSEPVSPVSGATGLIRFFFRVLDEDGIGGDDNTDDVEVLSLQIDPEDGVSSNAATRWTYTLPEILKGSNDYYIKVDANQFQDLDATPNLQAAYDGYAEDGLTTVADDVAPELTDITPDDNTLSVTTAGTDLVIEFDEPVLTSKLQVSSPARAQQS